MKENLSNIDVKIVSQISLMQSVIAQLPDVTTILDFTVHGFKEIPGVDDIEYFINSDNDKELERCSEFIHKKFLIKYKAFEYGHLCF